MRLFYNAFLTANTTVVEFDSSESRHITRVLRKKAGDSVQITNGRGLLFEAELVNIDGRSCSARIKSSSLRPALLYKLHLAVALTKSNDRFEWFLEKATEIGLHQITPLICTRSETTKFNRVRGERIILSALKQSLKFYLPILKDPLRLNEFLGMDHAGNAKFIAHNEGGDLKHFKDVNLTKKNICMLIGPEGGFTAQEIVAAKGSGFIPVSLGNQRFRTETAAVLACHMVALVNSDK